MDVMSIATLEALVRVRLVGGTEHDVFEKHLRADPALGELRNAGGHTCTTLVLYRAVP